MTQQCLILLSPALTLLQMGRVDEADRALERILEVDPDNFEALQHLTSICFRRMDFERALDRIRLFLRRNPASADAYCLLGNTFRHFSRFDEALSNYDRAIALSPNLVEAFYGRGLVLRRLSRHAEAIMNYDRAIAIKSDYPEALNSRGVALQELGHFEEAVSSYAQAISINPCFVEAYYNRAVALGVLQQPEEAAKSYERAIVIKPGYLEAINNLGISLLELVKLDRALTCFEQVTTIKPDHAQALNNKGNVLRELGRLEEAVKSYDRAIAIRLDFAEAFNNRGRALHDLGHLQDALSSFDCAINFKRDLAEALNNRGAVLQDLKRFDEAVSNYNQAIEIRPDYAEAFCNRALCKLLTGRYREGWEDYEWRWASSLFTGRRPAFPEWQGESLVGKSLLVFSEQGFGDVIQFSRFLPVLVRRGCRVAFIVDAKLIRLLSTMGNIDLRSALGPEQEFDFQCALMSVPGRLGIDITSVPNTAPYLKAERDLAASWKRRIGDHGFKIGIAWRGNPKGSVEQGRSFNPNELRGLAKIPGVRLISLQKSMAGDQPADEPFFEIFRDLDNGPDAFIDTAAVIANLDLVISCDTSIAHLAGALDRKTWIALKYVPHWVWMLDRRDSIWYPAVRVFRQREPGSWDSVFAEIEHESAVRTWKSLRSKDVVSTAPGLILPKWVIAAPLRSQSNRPTVTGSFVGVG